MREDNIHSLYIIFISKKKSCKDDEGLRDRPLNLLKKISPYIFKDNYTSVKVTRMVVDIILCLKQFRNSDFSIQFNLREGDEKETNNILIIFFQTGFSIIFFLLQFFFFLCNCYWVRSMYFILLFLFTFLTTGPLTRHYKRRVVYGRVYTGFFLFFFAYFDCGPNGI